MQNAKAWGFSVGIHGVIALLVVFGSLSFSNTATKESAMYPCEINMENIESITETLPSVKKHEDAKKVVDQSQKEPVEDGVKSENTIKNVASNIPSAPAEQTQERQASIADKKVEQAEQSSYKQSQKHIESEKKAFLSRLKKTINDNLIYPTTARRRAVEGDVVVSFVVSLGGRIDLIKIESGNQMFHQSVISAISSAKLDPPSDIRLPLEVVLTLTFNLDRL